MNKASLMLNSVVACMKSQLAFVTFHRTKIIVKCAV